MSQCDQDNDPRTQSRRHFLKLSAGTAAVAAVAGSGLFSRLAHAADLPHLSESDPMAKALAYVNDASKSTNPKHKAGAVCANCQFYQGKSGDTWGPCQLFPGKSVHAKGWCVSHQDKA